ncbi:putative Complement factor B protein, partial [Naja naja]
TVDGDCDPKAAEILGGNYTVLEDGTTLAYDCAQGQYPYPTQFRFCENGNQWSDLKDREDRTQFYEINQELKYTCYGGYQLLGPQMRTCLPTGKWSGETAISGDCRNPGIPIGAQKYGTAYQVGGTVRYQCSRGLSLIGSKERVCQESGIWSGSEPECRKLWPKKINQGQGSIVEINPEVHERKPGTNIANGLRFVYEMMIMQDVEEKRRGLNPTPVSTSVHHILIVLTDGNYNLGGFPSMIIQEMKEPPNVESSSPATVPQTDVGGSSPSPYDDRLDVYVFGNGHDVNTEVINELASHKPSERHSFILKDLDELKEVLEKSLDDGESLPMCGISPGKEAVNDYEKYPWFARIVINDILTAAHCLAGVNGIENISVILGTTIFAVAEIQRHPQYNSQKVKNKGTPEFYDYDVALIKLKEKRLPSFARPVCLPCTIETTQILRKPHPQTTCKDHEQELLYAGNIPSVFITPCEYSSGQKSGLLQRTVQIKNGEKKIACNLDAKKAKRYENVTNISEVVREHFLCTGGIDPNTDPNVCSYDAGGPLLIQKRLRYIQVGVISWSVVDACTFNRSLLCNSEPTKILPSYARDFHINIFKILPWLKQHLGTKVKFL